MTGATNVLSCTLPLPIGFRARDILVFHRRDVQEVAERVRGNELQKGLPWRGHAACLSIHFNAGHAIAQLDIDGTACREDESAFENMVRRMLGLTQPIEDFERQYRNHPQLGPLITAQSGLRVPLTATPFEALTWAITGQQISVAAAVSLRRRLIVAAGLRHSSGLLCYPDAESMTRLSPNMVRGAGFSSAKTATLLALAQNIANGDLPLDDWQQDTSANDIRTQLLTMRGIGPWTVDYTLLRGFGWLDGSLHGDVAVRRGLQTLLAQSDKVDAAQARAWLDAFAPWRALVAAHLWAAQSINA